MADQDVFVSAVGGLKVIEPAADLALCLAIAGAHLNRALPAGIAVLGEVGLGGEVRHVHQLEQRMREAARLGYGTSVLPTASPQEGASGKDIRVKRVAEALDLLSPVAARS